MHSNDKINNLSLTSEVPPKPIVAKIDSGCSGHFFTFPDAKQALDNIKYETGPTGILPDKSKVTSGITGNLPIPGLSAKGSQAYGFKGITNSSLMSVATF